MRWARLQKGWSLEELARQIKDSMRGAGERVTALSADTVRRWETGERKPAAEFRKHLLLVLGGTADELGLLSADELALRPTIQRVVPSGADDELVAGLVAETVKQVLHVVRDETTRSNRGVLVGRMLDASAAPPDPVRASTSQAPNAPGFHPYRRLDRRTVEEFDRITASQRGLYSTTDADVLLDAVLPHLRLGIDLLILPQAESGEFQGLAGSVAQTALLAARMAFFDLGDVNLAKDCFTLATHAIDSCGDHALSAAVHAHQAFVPGFAGDVPAARALLEAAHAHVRFAPGPRLRSWLHCVSGEIAARAGDVKASVNHVRQAEQALATRGEDPVWLDFFDEYRLAGFAGQVYLLAGKASQSAAYLRRALDNLESGHKQRSVLLLDLAAAQAPTDAEAAAASAHQALDVMAVVSYAAAIPRLPQVLAALRATPFAADLRDRIRALRSAADLKLPGG